jgi:K+-transporting ATPase KdpF subunit
VDEVFTIVAAVLAVGLLAYLTVALLAPEKLQ